MAQGNEVTLVGNTTRDPELRFTPSGQATASFGLAVNRRWHNHQTNDSEEATSFFDVICWGSLAENTAQSLTKGTRVVVAGRLEKRSWESPESGKRSKVEIVADDVGPSLRWATAEITKTEPSQTAAAPAGRAEPGPGRHYEEEQTVEGGDRG